MKFLSILFLIALPSALAAQSDTVQRIIPDRRNAIDQQKKPYVILISIDGFRADYPQKFDAKELINLGKKGVIADYMKPAFPSLTFPNHLSIVTGLYPSHHGIVDNMFYDRTWNDLYTMNNRKKVIDGKWYHGTPLWVLAEHQKMVSASFYWVGSESPIDNVYPTYYYTYNEKISFARRLAEVRKWLTLPADQRPHLITFYFPEVDHQGHFFGPDAIETGEAVSLISRRIKQLADMTDSLKLPVNFIVVSDHGMAQTDTTNRITVPPIIKDTTVCRWTWASNLINIYVKDKKRIAEVFNSIKKDAIDFDVYKLEDTPEAWQFRRTDDRYNRMGDIVIASHLPKYFNTGKGKQHPGKHGYDPSLTQMRATFIAWGPQIKKLGSIPPFENVNVYPFVANILGLQFDPKSIDGKTEVLQKFISK